MARWAIIGALMLAGAGPAWSQSAYTPPEGDFSASFVAAPTVQIRPAKRMSDVAYRRYVDEEGSHAFSVGVAQYPDGDLPPDPNGAVYDRLLRSYAEGGTASLTSTRAARLAGRPCLEGTLIDSDGNVEVVRVLILGARIYRVSYAHADGVDAPGAADAFFSTFKVMAAAAAHSAGE